MYISDGSNHPVWFRRRISRPADFLNTVLYDGYRLAYDCQRKLGKIFLIDTVAAFIQRKNLGIDALDPDLDLNTFKSTVCGRRAAVKSTLMDQSCIAGIGNVYSDEILFQAGIHPKRKGSQLTDEELRNVFEAMRDKVLPTAVECRADSLQFPETFISTRRNEGEACPRCGGTIEKAKLSGRIFYFCPNCQPPH